MKKLRKIEEEHLSALKQHKGIQVFQKDMDVLKNNEVPPAALVIVEGEADVLKHEEETLKISPGYAIGMDEVNQEEPAKLHLRAKQDLKAIILSKLDFLEGSAVFHILDQVLKSKLSS